MTKREEDEIIARRVRGIADSCAQAAALLSLLDVEEPLRDVAADSTHARLDALERRVNAIEIKFGAFAAFA